MFESQTFHHFEDFQKLKCPGLYRFLESNHLKWDSLQPEEKQGLREIFNACCQNPNEYPLDRIQANSGEKERIKIKKMLKLAGLNPEEWMEIFDNHRISTVE